MTGGGRFREYRKFVVALVVMAALSPLGLYLPRLLGAGGAWGEWDKEEIAARVGYVPDGMRRTADRWKAPLPDYALPGRKDAPSRSPGLAYALSGLAGLALCGGVAWLLGRSLAGRKGPRP